MAADDPGGATALLPVIRVLAADESVGLSVVADGPALRLFTHAGVVCAPACESAGPLEVAAETILARERPRLLVTASSERPGIERALTVLAARSGVPSVCVLDHWSGYGERFSGDGDRWRYLPDWVFVMDEHARADMIALGAPADRLVVAGHPHLAALARSAPRLSRADRDGVRDALAIPEGHRLVTFASETFGWGWDSSYRYPPLTGRGERTIVVLEHVIAALTAVRRTHGVALTLVTKLHPKNSLGEFAWLAELELPFGVRTIGETRNLALMAASDVVVGMTSMFMLEAACLGTPVVCAVPRAVEERLLANRYGARCTIARSPHELRERLAEILLEGGATKRRGADAAARGDLGAGISDAGGAAPEPDATAFIVRRLHRLLAATPR